MRLDQSYCVRKDTAHFVNRQIDLLNRERTNNNKSTSFKHKSSTGSSSNLQGYIKF